MFGLWMYSCSLFEQFCPPKFPFLLWLKLLLCCTVVSDRQADRWMKIMSTLFASPYKFGAPDCILGFWFGVERLEAEWEQAQVDNNAMLMAQIKVRSERLMGWCTPVWTRLEKSWKMYRVLEMRNTERGIYCPFAVKALQTALVDLDKHYSCWLEESHLRRGEWNFTPCMSSCLQYKCILNWIQLQTCRTHTCQCSCSCMYKLWMIP